MLPLTEEITQPDYPFYKSVLNVHSPLDDVKPTTDPHGRQQLSYDTGSSHNYLVASRRAFFEEGGKTALHSGASFARC